MKIDSHQHFWNYNDREYSWMKDGMEILQRDYTPQDLTAVQAEIGFDGSVAVQARMTPDETRWLLELAAQHKTRTPPARSGPNHPHTVRAGDLFPRCSHHEA